MRHRLLHPLTALVVMLLAAPGVAGQAATQGVVAAARTAVASPTAPGLDPVRAARIDAVIQRYVAEKKIAGVVALVARHGRIAHLEAYGRLDVERNTPMTTDAIFRIASMSKAVTSVAVMMLVEEGALQLSDPVSRYIPAFKETTVVVKPAADAPAGAPPSRVAAKRPITVRDLLTHTAGISYGVGSPFEAEYRAAGALGWYFADKDEPVGAVIDRLAALPFDAQPGERYVYGFGTDILGRVVEVASGLTLDQYFRTRIFEPLKMADTAFFLPREKATRLATVYSARPDGTIERAPDRGQVGQGEYVDGPRRCYSGGAGLLSTARDYARLLQMLLNGGALDGVRLLSPASVALMTSNHVGALYSGGDTGFGLGFEVVEHVGRAGRLSSVGEFGWGGAYYTKYWVDPAHDLVAVFMAQLLPAGGLDLQNKFRTLVYQAITDGGR
jgi:CubicO group peptidase (beta-lactamase class C family)